MNSIIEQQHDKCRYLMQLLQQQAEKMHYFHNEFIKLLLLLLVK